jgi:glycosyltransferase involved in cell wall biosynthesis
MKKLIFKTIIFLLAFFQILERVVLKKRKDAYKIGFLVDEFFHKECCGFGGYGMTVKNLTDHFNLVSRKVHADVFLTRILNHVRPEIKRYHNADVLFRPLAASKYAINFSKYAFLALSRNIDLLVSIDWYHSYEYSCNALPMTPLLIWIKDPRGLEEWEKIAAVPYELEVSGGYNKQRLQEIVEKKKKSVQDVLKNSKRMGRKVLFVTQANCLLERARRSYGLEDLQAIFLPNPITLPTSDFEFINTKPTVCLLGRLEPVKRPWIFFELAKRFPHVDFLVAGITHFKAIMAPVFEKYSNITNLKFLGMVDGNEKIKLLRNVWAVVNTSVHEALPVSFLEAFAYGKPVVSCQNPDDLTSRFGYYAGEVLGEGLDEKSLNAFEIVFQKMLDDSHGRQERGQAGRAYVERVNSYSNHENILLDILEKISLL